MEQIGSAITGLPQQGETQPSLIGKPHGETGSAIAVQPERLLARSPQDNLAAAVSSLQDFGISVSHEVTGSKFPKNGGWEPVMSLMVRQVGEIDMAGAKAVIDGLAAPAPRSSIIEWLTICAVKTVSSRDDDTASDLKLKMFASKLQEYPGDVVKNALDAWPDTHKWFPTWSELRTEIERMADIRPAIVERVRQKIGERA